MEEDTWCEVPLCSIACQVLLGIAAVLTLCLLIEFFLRHLMLDGLTERHILVTGCDTGFGWLLAKRLDGQGCHVFAACLTEEGIQRLKRDCSSRLTTLQLDVTDTNSVRDAVQSVQEKLPTGKGLWGVVNNAGIMGTLGPASWQTREDFMKILQVNALGMIDVSIQFLPLVKRSCGRVLLMSSVLGRVGMPCSTTYCVSKFAVAGFTEALRREMYTFGVKVIGIQPGGHRTNLIQTDNIRNNAKQMWDKLPDIMRQEYGEKYFSNMVDNGLTALEWTASSDLDAVVDAYWQGLFARYPRAVYLVGWDAYLYWVVSYLPVWMSDLMGPVLGLRPAQPPS